MICFSQVTFVQNTTIHPGWKHGASLRSPSNIALLQLSEKISLPVPQMHTNHFILSTGQKLVAAGWGSSAGPNLGDAIFGSLKTEEQEYISAVHCNRSTLWNGAIDSGMLCGLNGQRKASCIGRLNFKIHNNTLLILLYCHLRA